MERALARVRAGEDDPACRTCGGILKSATISFGQALVPEVIERAHGRRRGVRPAARRRARALQVYPAAYAVPRARAGRRHGRDRERRADARWTAWPTPSSAGSISELLPASSADPLRTPQARSDLANRGQLVNQPARSAST